LFDFAAARSILGKSGVNAEFAKKRRRIIDAAP
jgi:hypothetical protein